MVNFVNLRQTGSGWEFESEAALEDFLEDNLPALFGLHPLKRQHYVNEQFCDIVAVGDNKNLVILELKNTEDRYVVQQLTRYYDGLLEQQAFSDQVDYSQPVRLVAIAPSFHRDNFIDRKYHTLAFQFLKFSVISEDEKFYFNLIDIDNGQTSKQEITYEKQDLKDNFPSRSRALLNLLKKCNETDQAEILKLREHILSFDHRMQENSETGMIKYCKGTSQICCAELRFDDTLNQPALFLWLPNFIDRRPGMKRLRIMTDWENVLYVLQISRGIGKMLTPEQMQEQYNSLTAFDNQNKTNENKQKTIEFYIKQLSWQRKIDRPIDHKLNSSIELALQQWLKKLDRPKE